MPGEKKPENLPLAEKPKALEELQNAILGYDNEGAKAIARRLVQTKMEPSAVMDLVAETGRILGQRFESGQIYIPHLALAGSVMADISEIVQASVGQGQAAHAEGVVVIGTVEGDIHSIGKNIVAMMLKASGFAIHDLGVDVKVDDFLRQAESRQADILALSSLLTTTMPYQRQVIEALKELGLRDKYRVLVGGGPVSRAWADELGADGYGKDAVEAVKEAQRSLAAQAGRPPRADPPKTSNP